MKQKLSAALICLILPILSAIGLVLLVQNASRTPDHQQAAENISETAEAAAQQPCHPPSADEAPEAALQAFREWMQLYREAPSSERVHVKAQGIDIAKRRMSRMSELIRTDAGQALRHSLSLSEWLMLPAELRPFVEEPFSSTADFDVYISCGTSSTIDRITTLADGRQFESFTTGTPRLAKTRKAIPVQGIRLGEIGALRPAVFQPLNDADHAAATALYPAANTDPSRCFSTGRLLPRAPVAALAGGRIYYFENREALEQLEQNLSQLDSTSGPSPASTLLTSALVTGDPESGFDLEQAEQITAALTEAWSGSVRDMIVIMVDFSDIPGQPVNPVQLEYTVNSYISQQIYDMSFHQSYVDCTVLPTTYRLPEPSSYYTSNHRPIHDDAVTLATDAGIDLSGYETICVYFPFVPGLASLRGYAHIGGEKMWLHNTSSPFVITHELGHNYGSHHAHSWNVTGSNPVDPAGVHDEYGDFSDIMGDGKLPAGHFHVQNKLEIGWLSESQTLTVTNSGTTRIYRADHPLTETDTLRGLKLELPGTNAYWIGYRQLYPEHESYGRGTYVLWQQSNPSNYPKSHLLDMTPGSAGGKQDGGLALGKTWSDYAAQLHITPVHRGGSTPNEWVDITINLGNFSSNLPPVAALSGPVSGHTRQSLTFAVNASDPDGDTLAYSWDFGDNLVYDNAHQAAGVWMDPGTHVVRCIVSDMKGGSVTNEHTVAVTENLQMQFIKTIFATDLYDITTDGTKMVTVGKSGFVGSSTNGTDWITGNVGLANTWVYLYGIVHDGSQYVAAGKDYDWNNSLWIGVIYTSPDGVAWTRQHAGGPVLNDITYGGGMLVAAGESGTILTSSTGSNWTTNNAGVSGNLKGAAYNGSAFTVVGDATNYVSCVYVSSDGLTWNDRSANAGTGGWLFSTVESCNGLLLASGNGIGIRHSTDSGESFSVSTGEQLTIPAFAYGNGVYFAAGQYSFSTQADRDLVSTDGLSWTALPTADQNNRNAAVFFNNCFYTVSQGGSVWKSEPVAIAENGWALWQYHSRSTLGLNRDAGDDPDGDGVLNLVEYALGTDAGDSGSTPAFAPGMDEEGYLYMEIPRTREAVDIDYIVDRSTNLLDSVGWSSIETTVITNLPTRLIIRSAYPLSAQDEEFLRLRIGLKEPD